jgi:hypothetical protein
MRDTNVPLNHPRIMNCFSWRARLQPEDSKTGSLREIGDNRMALAPETKANSASIAAAPLNDARVRECAWFISISFQEKDYLRLYAILVPPKKSFIFSRLRLVMD